MSELLVIKQVSKSFGGLKALNEVSLAVNEGEILGLIGPNGSGKTTLVNCITGFLHADKGRIEFMKRDITKLAPHKIFLLGIGRTFQTVRIYGNLTPLQNLRIPLLSVRLDSPERRLADVMELMKLNDSGKEAKLLTVFEQKKLEIACRLVVNPKMLLLDEPAAGLSREEGAELAGVIQSVAKQGTSVLLVEHTMNLIYEVCDRVVVLDQGSKIAEGTPKQIFYDEKVIKSYLGKWRPPE